MKEITKDLHSNRFITNILQNFLYYSVSSLVGSEVSDEDSGCETTTTI